MRIFRLKNNNKKRAAVIAILAITASVIGVAIAAWTTGGSGSGQASAGSATSMTISAGNTEHESLPNRLGGRRRDDQQPESVQGARQLDLARRDHCRRRPQRL